MSFKIKNGVLIKNKGNNENVIIPDSVTTIGDWAFSGCKSLKSVTIPDSVTTIGEEAFYGCKSLESVTIPDLVTTIGDEVFSCCESLKSVTIPDSVITIGEEAFYGCKSLTSVTIPDSVTTIGNRTFKDCESLTLVTIPDSVTTIGKEAFYGCKSLTSIIIPDSVTTIGKEAFRGCKSLNSVTIPDSVTTIGYGFFSVCKSLKSVTIPDSVTTIGGRAFSSCESLTSVTIPESVTTIAGRAFLRCESLTLINVNENNKNYSDLNGILFDKNKKVLIQYPIGKTEQSYTIPDSVTTIGEEAFYGCKSLTSVTIPDSATTIGEEAFYDCSSLTSVTIPDSVTTIGEEAFYGCKSLTSIIIPDSVTTIGKEAFRGCKSLNSVTIGNSVTEIGERVFYECKSLTKVTLPDSVKTISEDAFRNCKKITEFITPNGLGKVDDMTVKKFILPNWEKFSPALNAEIFLNKHSKALLKLYTDLKGNRLNEMGNAIVDILSNKPSAKICNSAADYLAMYYNSADSDILKAIFEALKSAKTGEKAVETIKANAVVMQKIGAESSSSKMNPAEMKVLQENSEAEIEKKLKEYYTLEMSELDVIKDKEGKKLNPVVLAWLLMVHEKKNKRSYSNDIEAEYKKPGVCPKAKEVLELIDNDSLQEALRSLCDSYIGRSEYYRKNMLSFPICRYADEEIMVELTKEAPSWRSGNSGNNAPVLRIFRDACIYSEAECVVEFSERMHDLDDYAEIRNTDADTLRDTVLSKVDLDENGGRSYDLGNQVVTARLQSDCSFLIELPTGKTAKSIPKKGADEKLYEKAKADFSELKKSVKKVVRKRFDLLFSAFLYDTEKSAKSWKDVYFSNVALKQAAKMIVWQQGNTTFTMGENGLIDSNEAEYTLNNEPVRIAHPMEMAGDDLERWQKYFNLNNLKQPFAQIWEPVINPNTIREDRYKGCMIPYRCFMNQGKHGVSITDEEFHNCIYIDFTGLDATVDRIDWQRHYIDPSHNFEVSKIGFKKYTRWTNHTIAFLDKLTVYGRIEKDDASVVDMLDSFTLAQIMEFIGVAQNANAVNVVASLMEYKNNKFPDYDPMDEFVLE